MNTYSVPSRSKIPWIVVGMLFIVTALSFLDRQILSMTILEIKKDIPISNKDYSWITNGFIAGYAIMFTLGGVFIDKFGSKLGLAISLSIWAVAAGLHSVATSVSQLIILRFILGVGEGACFPGALKAVLEWIPTEKRSLANGIAIGGSAIGAVVAPLLVIGLLGNWGWRPIFLVSPVISIVWVFGWLYINNERNSKFKNNIAIEDPTLKNKTNTNKSGYSFTAILKDKNAWVFIVMRVLFDPIFYFLMFWIPKFMSESRHIPIDTIGKLFWIPYLVLGISNILGGYFSDKILKKTSNINFSRKILMGIGALMTLSVLFVPMVTSAQAVIALIAVFLFAHGIWITNYSTAVGDIFGEKATSTLFGLTGTFGAISSLFINMGIGYIVTKYSYDPVWIWAGLMYPLAYLLLIVFVPRIKKSERFS